MQLRPRNRVPPAAAAAAAAARPQQQAQQAPRQRAGSKSPTTGSPTTNGFCVDTVPGRTWNNQLKHSRRPKIF